MDEVEFPLLDGEPNATRRRPQKINMIFNTTTEKRSPQEGEDNLKNGTPNLDANESKPHKRWNKILSREEKTHNLI